MIEVGWDNTEKNIIIWTFSAPWTWDEFYDIQSKQHSMIDEVTGIVDSIFITSTEQNIPFSAFTHLREIMAKSHDRDGIFVVVGARPFLATLLNIVAQMLPNFTSRIILVGDKAEAYRLIAKVRESRQPVARTLVS